MGMLDPVYGVGAKADTPATTDTGTFSIVALIKRGLQNWTTLLGRVPAQGAAASAAALPVALATDDAQIGAKVTAVAALGAGGAGLIGWLSQIWSALTSPLTVGGITANPTSVLTRPANVTAYPVGGLIASSVTAVSIAVPTVAVARVAAGGCTIPKVLLLSNHTAGLANVSVTLTLWSAAPTYASGDGGAYAPATGAANFLGTFTGSFKQFGDGAVAELLPPGGAVSPLKLGAGQSLAWDLQTGSAFTPQSGKTFTAIPLVVQD